MKIHAQGEGTYWNPLILELDAELVRRGAPREDRELPESDAVEDGYK